MELQLHVMVVRLLQPVTQQIINVYVALWVLQLQDAQLPGKLVLQELACVEPLGLVMEVQLRQHVMPPTINVYVERQE